MPFERLARLNKQKNRRTIDSIDFLQLSKACFPETLLSTYASNEAQIRFAEEHTVYYTNSENEEESDWEEDTHVKFEPLNSVKSDSISIPSFSDEPLSPMKKKVLALSVLDNVFVFIICRDFSRK